jgi:hypothetical protein
MPWTHKTNRLTAPFPTSGEHYGNFMRPDMIHGTKPIALPMTRATKAISQTRS